MAEFMSGLARESDADFKGLSKLLATLPEPSQSRQEAMSVSEARDRGLIPEASDETLQAFSYSEMKLYKHAISYKWTVDELIATIKLIKSTDFKVEDVNVDLHKRVAAAIAKVQTASLFRWWSTSTEASSSTGFLSNQFTVCSTDCNITIKFQIYKCEI